VVTDYTGDPSLEAVREVVGDAYVRNFDVGARIQVGAFNTEEGAAALIEELQGQGIEAQVYEP
jgi:cell division septation protein DedD